MQIFAKIIVSIVIIGIIIGGIFVLFNVWTSDLDIRRIISKPFGFVETQKTIFPPEPAFKLGLLPSNYSEGLKVHDVIWSNGYRLYRFEFENKSSKTPMRDVRIEFEIPGGFVSKKIINQVGVNEITFSEDKLPAGIAKRPKGTRMGTLVKTIPYYSNRLSFGASEFYAQSSLQIDFVVKFVEEMPNGYFSFRFSYNTPDGEMMTEQHLHPIIKLDKSGSLIIDNDTEITGEHKRSIAFIPEKIIVFKPDGSVELKDK